RASLKSSSGHPERSEGERRWIPDRAVWPLGRAENRVLSHGLGATTLKEIPRFLPFAALRVTRIASRFSLLASPRIIPIMLNPTRALVRAPTASYVSYYRAAGIDVSLDALRAQHAAYAQALRDAGLAVTALEPVEQFPDGVFVEDTIIVWEDRA